MARRRRKRQRGGTMPVAPIVAGAKIIAKELLKRKKPILAALGPGVEIRQFLGKTFLKRRRNKRKGARRV